MGVRRCDIERLERTKKFLAPVREILQQAFDRAAEIIYGISMRKSPGE